MRGWVTEAREWGARCHLGLRGAVTRRAGRREIGVRPGREDPEDARPGVRGDLSPQRSRHCCHNGTTRAALCADPATPRRLRSWSCTHLPERVASAAAAAATAAAAPPRAARSSRPGRGPGRAAIGQVLTSQRRRRRELGSATRTDIVSDQSVVEGARLHGGAALVLRAVSTGSEQRSRAGRQARTRGKQTERSTNCRRPWAELRREAALVLSSPLRETEARIGARRKRAELLTNN